MNAIKAIYLTNESDPEVIGLINRFASLQQLKPTTAIKRYLLRNLPQAIKIEQESQEKSGKNSVSDAVDTANIDQIKNSEIPTALDRDVEING